MFNRILQPTDGSPHALRAAEYAADIARRYSSYVTILYVAEMPPVVGIPPSDDRLKELRAELTTSGREALRKTKDIFESANVEAHEELVFGSAVPDILRHAGDGDYDLIVIGSRGAGSGPISQILIGSVAEGILHSAGCTVLLVRPSEK